MAKIFWVEDQFHWINKFKPLLEQANFDDNQLVEESSLSKEINSASKGGVSESKKTSSEKSPQVERSKNQIEVHKFIESAFQSVNQSKTQPDIAILDANMNGNDDAGLSVARRLKQKWPQLPIIYLSEHSGTEVEEKAFEQNDTQDFIAKHQQNVEKVLCWRIKALLRQKSLKESASIASNDDVISSGSLKIDLTTWNVYWHDHRLMNPTNAQRALAPTPRKILRILVEASPRAVTTLQMAERLDSDKFSAATYRQHIKTLRHSFEQASKAAGQIDFIELCKQGKGIVTFGDEGGYCWKNQP